jgi:hypothetical protein
MVIALAGRRIDADGSKAIRFPLNKIDEVKEKLKTLFVSLHPGAIVCSGACGADLLALEVAGNLGIQRCMVLPFAPVVFKSTSVTDRPGDWSELFDKICKEVTREEKMHILGYPAKDNATYLKTNIDILKMAQALADKYGSSNDLTAVIVWEGEVKDKNDITAHFKETAKKHGFIIKEIDTIRQLNK